MVVASGNTQVDACNIVPANVPEVITVAASDLSTKWDSTAASDPEQIYRWSNTGQCVDIFAPGVDIYAACGGQRALFKLPPVQIWHPSLSRLAAGTAEVMCAPPASFGVHSLHGVLNAGSLYADARSPPICAPVTPASTLACDIDASVRPATGSVMPL